MTEVEDVSSAVKNFQRRIAASRRAIETNEDEITNTLKQLAFECVCGEHHVIRECLIIQTHWYTPPRGCNEGDYWRAGELHIVCPVTQVRNRCYFPSVYGVNFGRQEKFNRLIHRIKKSPLLEEHDKNSSGHLNRWFEKNLASLLDTLYPSSNAS